MTPNAATSSWFISGKIRTQVRGALGWAAAATTPRILATPAVFSFAAVFSVIVEEAVCPQIHQIIDGWAGGLINNSSLHRPR
jgi:hypothetical protein